MTSWQALARILGERMENHAYCDEHSRADADPATCPYCHDRWAHDQYTAKIGARPTPPAGDTISLRELRQSGRETGT